jgi:3-isopropylmalate dehydrogenase
MLVAIVTLLLLPASAIIRASFSFSFGMKTESDVVINAVDQVLKQGLRTVDIADANTKPENILGTDAMGAAVLKFI